MSDEIYGQMTYDGLAHQTLLAYPEIRDRLILLDGWSKTYAMTGWRLGYSVWPKPLYENARKLAVNSYSCVNASAQYAGLAALTGPQDAVHAMVAEFDRRRRLVVEGLNALPGVSRRRRRRARSTRSRTSRSDRLEGQAARLRAAGGGGRRHHRRAGLRRSRRGLYSPLLRQLDREHPQGPGAHGRVPGAARSRSDLARNARPEPLGQMSS